MSPFFKPNQDIKLIAKSDQAKNKIAMHGNVWEFVRETAGGRMLLRSKRSTYIDESGNHSKDLVWVEENDPHFDKQYN